MVLPGNTTNCFCRVSKAFWHQHRLAVAVSTQSSDRKSDGGLLIAPPRVVKTTRLETGRRSTFTLGKVLALLVIPCALFSPPVAAAPVAIDAREVEARRDFAEGRYQDAIHLFAELYAQSADPIHLRNIARCYQKMGRPDEAIANFRDYLAKANVDAEERREVQGYIAEMEALRRNQTRVDVENQQGATGVAANAPTSPPSVTAPITPVVPAVAPATVVPPADGANTTVAVEPVSRAPLHGGGRPGFRTAGTAVAATGAVLAVTGALFGWATYRASQQNSKTFDGNRDVWGPRYETLQFIGYATGAVGLLAGAGLYWYGTESREREHARAPAGRVTAAIRPWPAALLVEGQF